MREAGLLLLTALMARRAPVNWDLANTRVFMVLSCFGTSSVVLGRQISYLLCARNAETEISFPLLGFGCFSSLLARSLVFSWCVSICHMEIEREREREREKKKIALSTRYLCFQDADDAMGLRLCSEHVIFYSLCGREEKHQTILWPFIPVRSHPFFRSDQTSAIRVEFALPPVSVMCFLSWRPREWTPNYNAISTLLRSSIA